MLNLQGQEQEDFTESLKMMVRTDHGRAFLAALEKDLALLDAKNRVMGKENETGAAFYLALLFQKARSAGYSPTYHYAPTDNRPAETRGRWQRILSALTGMER